MPKEKKKGARGRPTQAEEQRKRGRAGWVVVGDETIVGPHVQGYGRHLSLFLFFSLAADGRTPWSLPHPLIAYLAIVQRARDTDGRATDPRAATPAPIEGSSTDTQRRRRMGPMASRMGGMVEERRSTVRRDGPHDDNSDNDPRDGGADKDRRSMTIEAARRRSLRPIFFPPTAGYARQTGIMATTHTINGPFSRHYFASHPKGIPPPAPRG